MSNTSSVIERIQTEVKRRADEKTSSEISDVLIDHFGICECKCGFYTFYMCHDPQNWVNVVQEYTKFKKLHKKWNRERIVRRDALYRREWRSNFTCAPKRQISEMQYQLFLSELKIHRDLIDHYKNMYNHYKVLFDQSRPCKKCYPLSTLLMKGFHNAE